MCPLIVPTLCRSCRLELGMGDDCPVCEWARLEALVEEERLAMLYGEASLFSPGQPERDTDWDTCAGF
jgi:hypothetical protein